MKACAGKIARLANCSENQDQERKTIMKKLVAGAFVILTAVIASAATRYEFLTIAVPGSVPYSTIPMGINNNEVIVGYYQDNLGGWHGFTYNESKRTWVYPIDYPVGPPGVTWATSINDSGVVGGYYEPEAGLGYTLAFTDSGGFFSPVIVYCTDGNLDNRLAGINNTGFTVGNCFAGSQSFSWVWALGNPGLFTCPATAASSGAAAINNEGQVVGWYTSSASKGGGYVAGYSSCGYAVNYPGAIDSELTGINDSGTAIGWAFPKTGINLGFFYNISSGQFTKITPPTAAVSGLVTAGMNNSNWFVGYYIDKNYNNNGFFAKPI
jgi:hypothetical protein